MSTSQRTAMPDLDLVRALLEGSLLPYLDDAVLGKLDPKDWARPDSASQQFSSFKAGNSNNNSNSVEAKNVASNSIEEANKENLRDGRNQSFRSSHGDINVLTGSPIATLNSSSAAAADTARKTALSNILLADEAELGSNNTIVNEIPELRLPSQAHPSEANVARLLLTNTIQASLVQVREYLQGCKSLTSIYAAQQASQNVGAGHGGEPANTTERGRALQLLRMVYGRECEEDNTFADSYIEVAEREGRLGELVQSLLGETQVSRKLAPAQQHPGGLDAGSNAFTVMAMMEMQMSTLEHAFLGSDANAGQRLVKSTCSHLMELFAGMPLGVLSKMASWEHETFDALGQKLMDLAQGQLGKLDDESVASTLDMVDMFLLAMSLQRSSLDGVIATLRRIMDRSEKPLADFDEVLDRLLQRLSVANLYCPIDTESMRSDALPTWLQKEENRTPYETHVRWSSFNAGDSNSKSARNNSELLATSGYEQHLDVPVDEERETKSGDPNSQSSSRPLRIGDYVRLADDAVPNAALAHGERGRICFDNPTSATPFRVYGPRGDPGVWFSSQSLVPAKMDAREDELRGNVSQIDVEIDEEKAATNRESCEGQAFPWKRKSRDALSVSHDGRFLYICGESIGGIARVGSGAAGLGSTATLAGHVYAHFPLNWESMGRLNENPNAQLGWTTELADDKLLIVSRRRGSAWVEVQYLQASTLSRLASPGLTQSLRFRLTDVREAIREQFVGVRGADMLSCEAVTTPSGVDVVRIQLNKHSDSDGSQTPSPIYGTPVSSSIAWMGSGSAWITGSGCWYFEVTLRRAGLISVGWATPAFFNEHAEDNLAAAWTMQLGNGTVTDEHGISRSWGEPCKEGDIIGCTLDTSEVATGGTVRIMFSKNGSWAYPFGTAFTVDGPVLYARPVIILGADPSQITSVRRSDSAAGISSNVDATGNTHSNQLGSKNEMRSEPCVDVCIGSLKESEGEPALGRGRLRYAPASSSPWRPVAWSAGSSLMDEHLGDELDTYEEEDDDDDALTDERGDSISRESSPEKPRHSFGTSESKVDANYKSPGLYSASQFTSSGSGLPGTDPSTSSWPEHAAVLPPLTSDGRWVYCVERSAPLLPGAMQAAGLYIRAFDPAKSMELARTWRVDQVSNLENFPTFERVSSWSLFTNGDDLVIVDEFKNENSFSQGTSSGYTRRCAIVPIATIHSVSPSSPLSQSKSTTNDKTFDDCWNRDNWPGGVDAKVRILPVVNDVVSARDAYSFSRTHSLVWVWNGAHNLCRAYDIQGFPSFDRSSWEVLNVSDRHSRRQLCVQVLTAIARVGAPFTRLRSSRGIFQATMKDLLQDREKEAMSSPVDPSKNAFIMHDEVTLEYILDILRLLLQTIRAEGVDNKTDVVSRAGVDACLRIILANSTDLPLDIDPTLTQNISETCLSLLKEESNGNIRSVQEIAVDFFAQALPIIFPTLQKKVQFIQQELSTISVEALRSKRALARLYCIVIQSMTANLLLLPFEKQIVESAGVLPRILNIVEKLSFDQLGELMKLNLSSQSCSVENDSLAHLCDASNGLLVSLLNSGLCDASVKPSSIASSSLVQIIDIFSVVLEKCSAILSSACDAACSIQTNVVDVETRSTHFATLSKIVQHSLVGRVFPIVCGWLEFLFRSPTTRTSVASALLSNDHLLGSMTHFVGLVVQFSSALASEGASLTGKSQTSAPLVQQQKSGPRKLGLQRRSSTIVMAAAIAAQQASASKEKPWTYAWSRTIPVTLVYESDHEYSNNTSERRTIEVPGAKSLKIVFDERTSTEENRDFLRFLRIPDGGRPEDAFRGSSLESCPEHLRYGEERYSGSHAWPGVNGVPPLVIPGNKCVMTFISDSSDVDWGYRFKVIAEVSEVRRVTARPWIDHLAGMSRDLVSSLIGGMVGSSTTLSTEEMRNLRWVQNPILSGGLVDPAGMASVAIPNPCPTPSRKADLPPMVPRKMTSDTTDRKSLPNKQVESKQSGNSAENSEDHSGGLWKRRGANGRTSNNSQGPTLSSSLSNPKLPLRSRARTHSSTRLRLHSLSEDDRNKVSNMLIEMMSPEFPPPNLGGALFQALRSQRVPLDQGFFTHRAAAALGAALIRVNGLEREALRVAKAHLNAPQNNEPPSARLLKVWSAAQYIRSWADQLVVNGQVQHHVEASLPDGSPLRAKLLDKISRANEYDDAEEPLYEAICEIVSERARFLIMDVAPPTSRMISLRSACRDAARARWHRLRRHFCPRTQRMLQEKKRWDVLLGALRALSSLRSMVDRHRSAAQKMAISLTRTRSSTLTRPSSYESDLGRERAGSRDRSISRDRSLSRDMPADSAIEDAAPSRAQPILRLGRGASGTLALESPLNTPPHLLSARSASSTNSASSAKSSHFNFHAPFRRRERVSGGLRRNSIVEVDGDVDMFVQEHDQSLSDSVNTFLQAAVPVDADALRAVLAQRNERALMRTAGFDFINNLTALARTEMRHRDGKLLFDTVLSSTTRALRGMDNTHHLTVESGKRILTALRSEEKENIALIATEAAVLTASSVRHLNPEIAQSLIHDAEQYEVVEKHQQLENEARVNTGQASIIPRGLTESHFMTDLPGCSLSLRESVTRSFLSFLRSINVLLQLSLRQQNSVALALRGERKVEDDLELTSWHKRNLQALLTQIMSQIQQYIHVVSLDYVEGDFDLLAESDIVTGLRSVLFHDFKDVYDVEVVRSVADKCFELLLRRCICETGQEAEETLRFTSGNSLQQSLLDVLVALLENSLMQTVRGMISHEPQGILNSLLDNTQDVAITDADEDHSSLEKSSIILRGEDFNIVADRVDLDSRVSTINFRLHFSDKKAGHFRAGRLFSIGNPQVEVDAISATTSQYIAGPPDDQMHVARFAFLEVGLDAERRLVVTVGDLVGVAVTTVSEFALPDSMDCEISVVLRECSSIEMHIVSSSFVGEKCQDNESRIYTVEEFYGVLLEVGQLPINMRHEYLLSNEVQPGMWVRILRGAFSGYTGFVLGLTAQTACVCIDFRRLHSDEADAMDMDVGLYPIAVPLTALLCVAYQARSLHRGITASALQAIMSSLPDISDATKRRQVHMILETLGLDEEMVDYGLRLFDAGLGEANPVHQDNLQAYALQAPLYIGGCPEWGRGVRRGVARGVIIQDLHFDRSSAFLPKTSRALPPTSSTSTSVADAPLPSATEGGVILYFPLSLLSEWNEDETSADDHDGDDADAGDDSNVGGGVGFDELVAALHFVENPQGLFPEESRNEQSIVRALEVLSLAYAACASPVGRARLTAPYALTLLLRTCISDSAALPLRIASTRVLAALLVEVPPLAASKYALGLADEFGLSNSVKEREGSEGNLLLTIIMHSIGGALHLASGRIGLQRTGFEARAMAMQLVELVHGLCAAETWAQTVAAWVAAALDRYADTMSTIHGTCLIEVMGALAVIGGVFESPRIGGRSIAASSNGLLSRNEVVVLGKVPQTVAPISLIAAKHYPKRKSHRPVDITARMKVQVSTGHPSGSVGNAQYLLDSSPNYWESNGYTPHWVQMVCPSGYTFHTIGIYTNESFENYSPEKVEVRLGPTPESLRTVRILKLQLSTKWVDLVQESDVRKSDRVFRLEITSNHAGGCDSRIQQLRVLARHQVEENTNSFEALDQQYHVRPVYGSEASPEDEETKKANRDSDRASFSQSFEQGLPGYPGGIGFQGGNESGSVYVENASRLEPIPLIPPSSLLTAFHGDLVKGLQRILAGEPSNLVHSDVRARAAKSVSMLLENQALVEQLGEALMPQLLQEVRARTKRQVMTCVPVRWALSEVVAQHSRLSVDENEIAGQARIAFANAGKLHRAVAVDMSPMVSGKHSWEVTLDVDIKDDETAMFGITSLAHLGSEMGAQNSGAVVENILKPSADFWMIQAYNGHRIHEGVSMQWEGAQDARVHPGDTIRFLLDMDMGTLSVAVNDKPLTRVFYGIDKRATWGVYPCVASYGNRSEVLMTMRNMCTTTGHGNSVAVPQRHIFLHGSDANLEIRAARISELLVEGVALVSDYENAARSPPQASSSKSRSNDQEQTEPVLDLTSFESDSSLDLHDIGFEGGSFDTSSTQRERSASAREAMGGSAGLQSSGLSASQQMIQKINVLYEIADSSAEEDMSQPSPLTIGSVKRDHEVQILAMAILSDARFVTTGLWLGAVAREVLECLYDRYCNRALEKLVVDWSLCTSRPLPQYLLQGSSLQRTINLVFRSTAGEQGDARAVDAIMSWSSGADESRVKDSLLSACTTVFTAVGHELSLGVQADRERLKMESQAREAEDRDAVTALAQVREARRPASGSHGSSSSMQSGSRREGVATPAPAISTSNALNPPRVRALSTTGPLEVGDIVRARFMGGPNWFSGYIANVYPDGTYAIDYDDGDKETHVPRNMIAPLSLQEDSSFAVGDIVQARFCRGSKWYRGRIARTYEGGQYDILYDDGDLDRRLEGSYVRAVERVVQESSESTAPNQDDEPPPADATLDERPGQYVLIADRYRGDIPASGKPDSAQVSIINSPSTADGYIRTVKLRLAEPPAGGFGSWDVIVFERAGDTSTFFVVGGTPTQPTCGTIHFDPHSTDIQTVPVDGTVYISQGQYLGVINRRGRLNVAYTPGKKKIEESWALKPVEVFYLMPKSVPEPFEGGPHRTRLWHGRAGWCATMQIANAPEHEGKSRYLRQNAEDIFAMRTESGIRVQESVRQACWLLTVLVRENIVPAMQILNSPSFLHSLRRVCDHGIFCIDGDSGKLEEISSPVYEAWLPVINLISLLCNAAVSPAVTTSALSGQTLPRSKAEALILLQAVLETKVNEMNEQRQRRLRDLVKTRALLTSSNAADATAASTSPGNASSTPAPAASVATTATFGAALPGPTASPRGYLEAMEARCGGPESTAEGNLAEGANDLAVNGVQYSSWRSGVPGRRMLNESMVTSTPPAPRASSGAHSLLVNSANYRANAGNRTRMSDIGVTFAHSSPTAAQVSTTGPSALGQDDSSSGSTGASNNVGQGQDSSATKVADGLLRLEHDEKGTVAGIRFQKLLKCLVSVDDLTRKDGLDGEALLIDSPRRALKEDSSWEDHSISLKAQFSLNPSVLSFEHFHGRLCISAIREKPLQADDEAEVENIKLALRELAVGDELIAVEGQFLESLDEKTRSELTALGMAGPQNSIISSQGIDSEGRHMPSSHWDSSEDSVLDFSQPYVYNGVVFPPLEVKVELCERSDRFETELTQDVLEGVSSKSEISLTFRRRRGEFTVSQKNQLGKGISYNGIRESLEGIQGQLMSSESSGSTSSLDNAEWLDSLVTATELLKAFACQMLPPDRFLKDQFVRWCQHVKGSVVESEHPVFQDAFNFVQSSKTSLRGDLMDFMSTRSSTAVDYTKKLSRQRTHSRMSDDDISSMDGLEHSSSTASLPRVEESGVGVSSVGQSLSKGGGSKSQLEARSVGVPLSSKSGTSSHLSIPGATALNLSWDMRSCLRLGNNSSQIVVHVDGREFRGTNGLPPNLSVVSGSTLALTIEGDESSLISSSTTSNKLNDRIGLGPKRSEIAVAGLRNRAGAYIWLGTRTHFRAKFFCGRLGSEIAGWTSANGMCGPDGDHQCPDCSYFTPRNMSGLNMRPGSSRDIKLQRMPMKDLLYCDRCMKNHVPCADCRRFLAVMARTQRMTRIPYRVRGDFDSDESYTQFLNGVVVPGMPMRVSVVSARLSGTVRPGSIVEVQLIRPTGRTTVTLLGRSHPSSVRSSSSFDVSLRDLELVPVRDIGGQDLRSRGANDRTLSVSTARDASGHGDSLRRTRGLLARHPNFESILRQDPESTDDILRRLKAGLDDIGDEDDDIDDLAVGEDGTGTGARREQHRFLEVTDFLLSSEYARYMTRNCHVHDKVRCSKRYESVAEGDVGEVIRIDEGDDLPCQVLWEKLGTQYWLPWDCLSLNLVPQSRRRGAISGRDAAAAVAAALADKLKSSRTGSSGRPGARDDDETSVTFASQPMSTDSVEVFNNNRSITKATRSSGWSTQRLNCEVDEAVPRMNVYFHIDDMSGPKLLFGVVATEGFGGENNERELYTPMTEVGAWALRCDGQIFSNGVRIRSNMSNRSLKVGDIITVSVDVENSMVTFLRNDEVLSTICGVPPRVVPAISLTSTMQRVSIRRVEVGDQVKLKPIEGWGYRLNVAPIFDPSSLQSQDGASTRSSTSSIVRSMDGQFKEYILRQHKWTRRQDEALVSYVNETVARSDMDLSELLKISWDELYALSPLDVQELASDGELGEGSTLELDDLPSVAEAESLEFGTDNNMQHQGEGFPPPPMVRRGASFTLLESNSYEHTTPIEDVQRHLFTQTSRSSLEPLNARKKKKRPVSVELLGLVRDRASIIGGLHQNQTDGTAGGRVQISLGDDVRMDQDRLRETLLDIAQRFELVRSLNRAVHEALGLLDLSAWRDIVSTAAHLSECSGILFDKFKVPLWLDAISSTKAEDIHKFDVVLDFGKAMSKRHLADVHGRHTVFAQAFRVMHPMPAKTLRAHGKLYKCVMRGMASHDDGGPYRQSFSEYCKELQTLPGVGLLLPCSNRANEIRVNRDRWLPNPAATSPVQISMFEFLGKLMGIAIRNRELLDLRLPSLVWKPLVNQVPTIDDLRAVDVLTVTNTDPDCADPSALLAQQPMYYTVITLDGREVELVPNGRFLQVTPDNYRDWAQRVLDFKVHEFDTQVEAIRRGLGTIVPQRLLMLFRWEELELMVCGQPKIDINLLKRMTVYSDCSENDAHIQYFWEVLNDFSDEQRSDYLKFVWGRARLPMDRESWDQPHKISSFYPPRAAYGRPEMRPDDMLPYAHTCYFSLDLPSYSSKEVMRRKLLYAVQCTEIDGDQTTTGRMSLRLGFEIDDDDDDDAAEDSFGQDVYDDVEDAAASGGGQLPASPPPPPPPIDVDVSGSFNRGTGDTIVSPSGVPLRPLPLDTIAESIAGYARRRVTPLETSVGDANETGHLSGSGGGEPRLIRPSLRNGQSPAPPITLTQLISGATNMDEDPFGEYIDNSGDIQRGTHPRR